MMDHNWNDTIAIAIDGLLVFAVLWSKLKTGKGLKDLNRGIVDLTQKDVFKAQIHEKLEVVVINQLKHLKVNEGFKNLLFLWADKFEEMAIKSYFSTFRDSPDKSTYLKSVIGGFKVDVKGQLKQMIPERKKGKDVIDFMSENGRISSELEILKRALEINGLNDEEYVGLFADTLSRLLDLTIEQFQKWNENN